ncbi:MAG TPA: YajQ family cyclic di-GMP-binding protein [Candidatus Binatia bacterium]|nr:YajQ family cyclic di-GMP-binding protein [Candidatus Binatia bacterium]
MASFDVVCRVDLQEVDNAINQTLREIAQRFDFKNVKTEIVREANAIHVRSGDDYKVRAVGDVLREKLARRQVPLRAVHAREIEPGPAGTAKQTLDLQQGIPTDKARELVKLAKDTKLKVQVAIQGDQLRVSGKKKDDLQAIMKLFRERDLGIAVQFANFRD